MQGRSAPPTMLILRFVVQDPAAVFAAYNFFSCFYAMRRLGGHFHVATGADFVFQRNDHGIAFALEKALEAAQQIVPGIDTGIGDDGVLPSADKHLLLIPGFSDE